MTTEHENRLSRLTERELQVAREIVTSRLPYSEVAAN
jgi:hypothetical protein